MGSLTEDQVRQARWELAELECGEGLTKALTAFMKRQRWVNDKTDKETAGMLAQILGDVISDENRTNNPIQSAMLPLIHELVTDHAGVISEFLRFGEFEINVECVEVNINEPAELGLPAEVDLHKVPLGEFIK